MLLCGHVCFTNLCALYAHESAYSNACVGVSVCGGSVWGVVCGGVSVWGGLCVWFALIQ